MIRPFPAVRGALALAVLAVLVVAPTARSGSGVATATSPVTREIQSAMTPAQVLERLTQGNARFVQGKPAKRDLRAAVRATGGGQYPMAAIVSCLDSRTAPEHMFDLGPGDAFVARVAGNVVGDDFLGSLEFATKVSGAKLIVVVGHSACGAVKGACDGVELGRLTGLLAQIKPAVEAVPAMEPRTSKNDAFVEAVARQNVVLAMKRVRDQSPILRELIDSGQVGLAGAYYDIETGKVEFSAD
jgi:carbonic anhydrase